MVRLTWWATTIQSSARHNAANAVLAALLSLLVLAPVNLRLSGFIGGAGLILFDCFFVGAIPLDGTSQSILACQGIRFHQ
jgi:hypothetical protein